MWFGDKLCAGCDTACAEGKRAVQFDRFTIRPCGLEWRCWNQVILDLAA